MSLDYIQKSGKKELSVTVREGMKNSLNFFCKHGFKLKKNYLINTEKVKNWF